MLKNKNLIKYFLCLSIMLFVGDTASAECNTESIKQYLGLIEAGKNLHNKGDFKGAVDIYNNAIKICPEDWKVYNLRGEATFHLKNYKDAWSNFTAMEELTNVPKFLVYKGKAGILMAINSPRQSIEYIKKALDSYNAGTPAEKAQGTPEAAMLLADLYVTQGFNYYVMGDNKEALINFNKGIELRPNEWMYLGCKARTLARMGFINDAIKAYNKAIDIAPDQRSLQEEKHALIKRRSEK